MENEINENLAIIESDLKKDGWHKILFKDGDKVVTIYASPRGAELAKQAQNANVTVLD